MRKNLLIVIIVAVLVAAVYVPIWRAPFLPWDDDYNILRNPFYVIGPWWQLWIKPWYGMYVPVTSTVWKAMLSVGDGEAWPFRALNLVLHISNTVLVYFALRSLSRRYLVRTSSLALFVGTLIFALHPLQAGAVAWISGGRDLLSAFFSLSAILVFYRYKDWRGSAVAFLLFALSLLAKPQSAVLPLVLLAFGAPLIRLIPWFLAAAAATVVTYLSQSQAISVATPLWQRPFIMLDAYGFYLGKILLPFSLSADYGRTPEFIFENASRMLWTVPFAVLLLAAFLWGVFKSQKRFYILGLLWFLALLPVSGIVNFGFQHMSTVADHYNYLALVLPVALFTLAIEVACSGARHFMPITVVLILVLGWLTYQRAEVWSDERSLFKDMLRGNPNSYTAYLGLGSLACIRGQSREEGLKLLQRARELRPTDAYAIADVANCLFRMQRMDDVLKIESEVVQGSLLSQFTNNDLAAADLLTSFGGAYFEKRDFIAGAAEKAFHYLCQAVWRDPMQSAFRANMTMVQGYLVERGTKVSCERRLDLDSTFHLPNRN